MADQSRPPAPPAQVKCPDCEGHGRYMESLSPKHYPCFLCNGTGLVDQAIADAEPQRAEAPYITGLEQTPIQRLLEHQRKDEHTWGLGAISRAPICTYCGIAQSDWEDMREARAKLEVPPALQTDLERQLTQEVERLRAERDGLDTGWAVNHERAMVLAHKVDQMRAVVEAAKGIALRDSKTHAALRAALQALDHSLKT